MLGGYCEAVLSRNPATHEHQNCDSQFVLVISQIRDAARVAIRRRAAHQVSTSLRMYSWHIDESRSRAQRGDFTTVQHATKCNGVTGHRVEPADGMPAALLKNLATLRIERIRRNSKIAVCPFLCVPPVAILV